jgi:PAS domain S-box-containing protein
MRPVTDRVVPAAAETLVWFPVSGPPEAHHTVWLGLEPAAVHTLCSGPAVQAALADARVGKPAIVEVEPGRRWEIKLFFRAEDGLWCQIRDLTTQLERLDVLEQRSHQFDVLSTAAMEGIAVVREGRIEDCNGRFAELLGIADATDCIGLPLETWFDLRDVRRLQLRHHRNSPCEVQARTQSGATVFLEGFIHPGDGDRRDILLVHGITNRKRAERDLLETKERFRLLVESSPVGLFLAVDGKIRYANPAAVDMLDMQQEDDLYGLEMAACFGEADGKGVKEDLALTRQGAKPTARQLTLRCPRRHIPLREVEVRMTLSIFDREPAVQLTVTDLSSRVQLEREQLRAQVAEESNVQLREEIERHKATQALLRQAETLNHSIIESSIDMILAFDVRGRLIQFNQAASVEFGWTAEEAKLLDYRAFLAHPEEADRMWRALRDQGFFVGEAIGLRASGEEFNLLMSVAALQGDDGLRGSVVVGRDISDLKAAESELRRSEERYRDILENATDLIFLVDGDGSFAYANGAFMRALGYTAEELGGLRIHDVIEELPEGAWMEELEGLRGERTFAARNGMSLSALGGASARFDERGERIGLRCMFLDITDMRRHERAARAQSAKLESIFTSTRYLLMFTLDRDQGVTSVNANFREVFAQRFGVEVTLGMKFLEVLRYRAAADHYQGQHHLFERAFDGTAQQFEWALEDIAGEVVWFQMFVNPIRSDDGSAEVSCIAYDITERKEMEGQIRGALKEKEVLLQEVHHRVKNNLQVISSMLNLQRRFVSDPGIVQVLEESQNRIATMSFIHESLYRATDFSSIGFSEYLQRLAGNLMTSYARRDCRVELHTELEPVFLNLDQAIPCGLIVNELLSNAMKYAFVGRAQGVVTLRVGQAAGRVQIEVRDDGVGLPEGFDWKTHDSLGMYLVQALTEQLDGELEIGKGPGSSFLVSFTPST